MQTKKATQTVTILFNCNSAKQAEHNCDNAFADYYRVSDSLERGKKPGAWVYTVVLEAEPNAAKKSSVKRVEKETPKKNSKPASSGKASKTVKPVSKKKETKKETKPVEKKATPKGKQQKPSGKKAPANTTAQYFYGPSKADVLKQAAKKLPKKTILGARHIKGNMYAVDAVRL